MENEKKYQNGNLHVESGIKDNKQKSSLQKVLCLSILALLALVAVSVALAVFIVQNKKDDDSPTAKSGGQANYISNTGSTKAPTVPTTSDPNVLSIRKDVCISPECVKAAAKLLSSIDKTADPCEDFFQYACGQWRKTHVIEADKSITGVFYEVDDSVEIILKNLLEEKIGEKDIESVRKAKRLYQSCVNTDQLEKDNFTSAFAMIKNLGGWPVLEGNWQENSFNLTTLLINLRHYTNSPPLMDMYVYDDSKEPTKNILYIDQPYLGLPDRDYFLKGRDDKRLMAYEKYAREMAILFGADATLAKTDIDDIIKFEIEIANATMPKDERRDEEKLYNKMTINELATKYPKVEWLNYFNGALGRRDIGITVNGTVPVINRNPAFMELVNALSSKPKRVIQNYVIWRLVKMMVTALPQRARDLYGDFRKVLYGTSVQPSRWKTCVNDVNSQIGLAVGKPFLDATFDSNAKAKTDTMIENLITAMKTLLDGNEWMDTETKLRAKEKAEYIDRRIGYPPEVKNDTFLNNRYKDYEFNESDYFQSSLNAMFLSTKENLENLKKPVDRKKWETPPATVNAYYNPARNQIMFPAGILQPPFYKNGNPEYLNYGGIGYVIGHEITHGFDDNGRTYDKDGNLQQWWTSASIINFKERAKCIENQYSGYEVEEAGDGKTINGKLTLGENIADNGGLKESWLAYERWVENSNGGKQEPSLPGLEYTPKQMFFLSAAHVWCGLVRPEEARRRILVDSHSNFKSRVMGPLQNNKDFAEAFQCAVGSPMNPKKKCVIW